MDIHSIRSEIDNIDEQILNLLTKRAEYALLIGKVKQQNSLAIHSHEREEQIITNILVKNSGPLSHQDVRAIFQLIILVCRNLQSENENNAADEITGEIIPGN